MRNFAIQILLVAGVFLITLTPVRAQSANEKAVVETLHSRDVHVEGLNEFSRLCRMPPAIVDG